MSDRIVTCVYCGHEYPDGTPTSQNEKLTEHIKVCKKHPMRTAEKTIKKLRDAIVMLTGAEKIDELRQMKTVLEAAIVLRGKDCGAGPALNAINVLIETDPGEMERDLMTEQELLDIECLAVDQDRLFDPAAVIALLAEARRLQRENIKMRKCENCALRRTNCGKADTACSAWKWEAAGNG